MSRGIHISTFMLIYNGLNNYFTNKHTYSPNLKCSLIYPETAMPTLVLLEKDGTRNLEQKDDKKKWKILWLQVQLYFLFPIFFETNWGTWPMQTMQIHHWQWPHRHRWCIRHTRAGWCGYKTIRWTRRIKMLRQFMIFNADTAAAPGTAASQGNQRVPTQTSKPLRGGSFINLSCWCFMWISIHYAVGKEILPFSGVCIICLSNVFCRAWKRYSFFKARKWFGFTIVEFGYAAPAQ